MYGRGELKEKYDAGLKVAENCKVLVHGPVSKRPGLQYVAEVKDSSKTVRLVPFQVSATQSVLCEFGDQYIRFFTDKGTIESGGSPYEISSIYSEAEVANISYVQSGSKLFTAHGDRPIQTLIRTDTTDWEQSPYELFPPPTVENGYKPPGSITPGATTGLGITFTASSSVFLAKDVGRQIHNLAGTGKASIVGYTSATQVTVDVIEDFESISAISTGDWKLDLSPLNSITPSEIKVGAVCNITCTGDTFRSDDIGSFILLNDGVGEITDVTSATNIDAVLWKSLTSSDSTSNWSLEEPAWSSTQGYPRTVTLHDQRLVFAGTSENPIGIWASEPGIFDAFGAGANDADAIDLKLAAAKVSNISWLASTRDLVLGTSSSENTVSSGNNVFAPSTLSQKARTHYGSDIQVPPIVGDEALFIQGSGRSIRSFTYSFDIDSYKSEDLTLLCDHLTEDGIKELAYAQVPDNIIYAVTDAGDLLCGTFVREQNVIGWTKITTDGEFENVQVIREDNEDVVYVCVKRTINGATKRYIEVFDNGDGTSTIDGFSDSFLTYSGSSTTTLTGLDHLEGETVQVKVNGAAHADKTVSGGQITLDVAATTATVGIPYTMTVTLLDPEINNGNGTLQGQPLRWVEAILRVYKSRLPTVNGQKVPERTPEMEIGEPVDLYTGDAAYGFIDNKNLTITDSTPFPVFINAIFGNVDTSQK